MLAKSLRKILLALSCGAMGGLANSIVLWLFGYLSITTVLGVSLAPDFTPAWLYPRLVWGGIWGLLFLLPFFAKNYFIQGLVLSLFPSLIQLFVIFPQSGQGYLGFDLGILTPIFVLIFNAVWGVVGIYLFKLVKN